MGYGDGSDAGGTNSPTALGKTNDNLLGFPNSANMQSVFNSGFKNDHMTLESSD